MHTNIEYLGKNTLNIINLWGKKHANNKLSKKKSINDLIEEK